MNGHGDSHPFPYIRIHLRILGQQSEVEIEQDALLDTGFDGQVILPMAMLDRLGVPESTHHWTLADGSPALSYTYEGLVQLAGVPRETRVSVDILGSEVMIGRRLIGPFRVILDHGREVIVEP